MFATLRKIFTLKDLRQRVLLTVGLLIIIRLISTIPISGVVKQTLVDFFSSNQFLGLLDIFSGGTLSNFSIGLMGVGPYITASIIMQLLTFVVPSLDELNRESEQGRAKINQYTRMLTVPLAIVQSFSLIAILKNQGVVGQFSAFELTRILLVATSVSMIFMWIGEIISEEGIGNGISLIITIGILGGVPAQLGNTFSLVFSGGEIDTVKFYGLVGFLAASLLTVLVIVIMNEAIRKIPVSYARRVRGRQQTGLVDTYLPIKVNIAGVIPIIFALSIIVFPSLIGSYLAGASSGTVVAFSKAIVRFFEPSSPSYGISYFILVIFFTFFYTAIVFRPSQIAENLQKQGGFIPGIRPGKETENYVARVVQRITLPGSVFLGIIAVLPLIIQHLTQITTLVLGGTGILIIVSVVFETANQFKAHLITRSYDRY